VNSPVTALFIPGLLSDARVWQPTAGALSGLDVNVAFADVTRDDRIDTMASRILDEHPGPLVVIGHSMGGRVALEMAYQRAERVVGLVLANTGHGSKRKGELAKRQAKIDLGHQDMKALAAEWIPPMLASGREQDSALMGDLTDMVLAAGPEVHERQIMALVNRPTASTYLSSIICPTLLMTGDKDRWSPEPQHREIEELMPNATLALVSDAGHFMPIEQPAQTAANVRDWLVSVMLEGA